MKNRLRLMKVIAYVLGAAFLGTLFLNLYLPYEYAATRPRVSVPSEGRVIALNNHGTVVYLTSAEDMLLFASMLGSVFSGVFSGLLFLTIRRVELKAIH